MIYLTKYRSTVYALYKCYYILVASIIYLLAIKYVSELFMSVDKYLENDTRMNFMYYYLSYNLTRFFI